MDGAWKQYLNFAETHDEDDIGEHRECLDALKAGIREALKTTLHPRTSFAGVEDASLSLLLIERTMRGQTCSFGGHMFCSRQACIVLLNMLKLLPEPCFEGVASALVCTAAQLVEQLARQDISLLHSFTRDCIGAMCRARERPLKLHAFPKFVQLCKVAIADEGPSSRTKRTPSKDASGKSVGDGLTVDLVSPQRLGTFCTRLVNLTSLVIRHLMPFEAIFNLECFVEAMLGLASDAVSWSELAFEVGESAKIVSACINGVNDALQHSLSLQMQASLVEELPVIASFTLCQCDDVARRRLVHLTLNVVRTFDDAVLFPYLQDLLQSFWPKGAAVDFYVEIISAVAERFGAIGSPVNELWEKLLADESPISGSISVQTHARLAKAFRHLAMHIHVCRYAVDRCQGNVWEEDGGTKEGYLRLRLTSLAVRSLPHADKESAPHEAISKAACASLVKQSGHVFCKPVAAEPGVYSSTLQMVLETLIEAPECARSLETEGRTLIAHLTDAISNAPNRPPDVLWRLFILGLEAFAVQSAASFASKFKLLQTLFSIKDKLRWIHLAAWVAVGRGLLVHFKRQKALNNASLHGSSESSNEMLHVHKQLLSLIGEVRADCHSSILVAIAYAFPLILNLSYSLPGLVGQGDLLMMPQLSNVFEASSSEMHAGVLWHLRSPLQVMQNPLTLVPKCRFSQQDPTPKHPQTVLANEPLHSSLPTACPFCGKVPADPQQDVKESAARGCTPLSPPCSHCGMEGLCLDWQVFRETDDHKGLCLPHAWGALRRVGDRCCWLTCIPELLTAFNKLCQGLSGSGTQSALQLMEPGETQDQLGCGHPQKCSELMWLLSCGLFGLCVSSSNVQLQQNAPSLKHLLCRLTADTREGHTWDANPSSGKNLLLCLVRSTSFMQFLSQPAGLNGATRAALQSSHQLRFDVLNVNTSKLTSEGGLDLLSPTLLWATFAGAPVQFVVSALSSLVSGTVGGGRRRAGPANACLQKLFAYAMIAPQCLDDLFTTPPGNLYLRLFETYSRKNFRVAGLCELFLRGPLQKQVRVLLPKILPNMVLSENMRAIGDLCALLEESVQSLFTPQLPFILSAIARQPVQNVANAFLFILEHVYSNQMTIKAICDASLGKLLVLILWGSAPAEGECEGRQDWYSASLQRALSAIDNIVQALQARQPDSTTSLSQALAAAGKPSKSQRSPGKRKNPDRTEFIGGGVAALFGGKASVAISPPAKRRPGVSGEALMVSDEPAPEVVQTLEDNFLHVLDILEIVLSGNRQSPKWAEYTDLLQGDFDGDVLDYKRLFITIALLFELLQGSLHRFAAKILEFLQSATLLSNYHCGSVRCWQHFVKFVGVPRLQPLISAVMGELLRLAGHVRNNQPEACRQVCETLTALVDATCTHHVGLVPTLPVLPSWQELKTAKARIDGVVGQHTADSFVQKLSKCIQELESVTQQAVRSAALENINDLLKAQRRTAPTVVMVLKTPLLARLMRALLKFLWESSTRPIDQLHCGELLGTLGALDPSHFAHFDLGTKHASKTPQDLGNPDLLIKRILCDFLVPNLTRENSYAFAAQEVLKYLRVGSKVDRIMSDLKIDIRETLQPYLSSSYHVIEPGQMHSDTSTFEGVVARAASLVQGEERALYAACLPAIYGNHAFALFLMHHVLHHLLNSGTSLADLSELSRCLASLLDSPKHATAQAVFSLVDDMVHRREHMQLCEIPGIQTRRADEQVKKKQQQKIDHIMKCISFRKIVEAANRCGAHARALQFLEEALMDEFVAKGGEIGNLFDNPRIDNDDDCFLLQSIYRDLDEPDGVLGALRIGPATVRTRTLQLEQAGRWHDVLGCYENQLSSLTASGVDERNKSQRLRLLCSTVQCTQNMHRFETSLRLIKGLDDDKQMHTALGPFAVEAAWQLSSWDRLQQALKGREDCESADDFRVKLGQALMAFHEKDDEHLQVVLKDTRLSVTKAVASAARESYTRAYPHLLKLHVLSDLEWLQSSRKSFGGSPKSRLGPDLLTRLDSVAPTFAARQAVLSPLKVALTDMSLTEDAKHIELAFVRLCRKHEVPIAMEHPSVSFSAVSSELLVKAQMEWGRLLYARGSRHDALQHMQQLAQRHPKARLLGTRWATEASSELLIPMVAEAEFKEVKEKLPEDEAAWFYHASYLDQLLKEQQLGKILPGTSSNSKTLTNPSAVCPFDMKLLVKFTLKGYLRALHYGNKRMDFILSRVLQMAWDCCELEFHKFDALAEIELHSKDIQPWMWYTVLSQLISRVHNEDLRKLFSKLIIKVLIAYPMQSSWQMVQLLKSSVKDHQKLGNDLALEASRKARENKNMEVHVTLTHTAQVCQVMTALAQSAPPDGAQTMNLKNQFALLLGHVSREPDAWTLLVPLQAQMTAAIPRIKCRKDMEAGLDPFKDSKLYFQKCQETVEVLRTKERPKKITFLGNDGHLYTFLCKCERRGDLRKDSRMMEFGVMVNQLLAKDPDARRRNLEVRTFNVVILTESCGLLEWVPETKGMRPIIDDLWRRFRPGMQQSVRELKELFEQSPEPYKVFTEQVLPRHPPMLHKWFSLNADPSVWLSKRLTFSRSQALWCMLGYIVGLGDRHGENILLDTESGRMVQVDFDCLFGKGMELAKPETVPFRLTQNCVAAMGVTGVEGVFRNCCELVMGVLRDRDNQQTLLSVLHVFIADPLIEWGNRNRLPCEKQRMQQARSTIGDIEKKLNGMLNVGAVVTLKRHQDQESVLSLEERGRGLLGRDRGVGLSVAGQVDELLKAAMCKRNLSAMYIGWQPWV